MKLTINGAEVEIKVKGRYSEKYNKEDTMYFLNTMCGAFGDSAQIRNMIGLNAIAKESEEIKHDIYNHLEGLGFYD